MTADLLKSKYEELKKKAKEKFAEDGCSRHINAVVGIADGVPTIAGLHLSDWFVDGSTVWSVRG